MVSGSNSLRTAGILSLVSTRLSGAGKGLDEKQARESMARRPSSATKVVGMPSIPSLSSRSSYMSCALYALRLSTPLSAIFSSPPAVFPQLLGRRHRLPTLILDLCQPIDNWELLQITGLWSGQVDGYPNQVRPKTRRRAARRSRRRSVAELTRRRGPIWWWQ